MQVSSRNGRLLDRLPVSRMLRSVAESGSDMSEDRAIDDARVVTCPRCGRSVDLPVDAPWLFHDQLQHAPTLVAVRCPQCGHEIHLVS